MDAQELYLADGKSSGFWICGICKRASSLELATKCCVPRKCACGVVLSKKSAYIFCDTCRRKKEEEKEIARFNKAKKLTPDEYDGPVFSRGDTYYSSLEDFLDQHDGHETYVWCATPIKFSLDIYNMLSSSLDEHYEDAYDSIPNKNIVELQDYVDKWAEAQHIVSYEIDLNNCVIIESEADKPLIVS